ncbi:hypothetical protein EJ04DRAFT_575877 [Polyplosphaeria fusca]|uniref:Uncharacterized protein n=1 Tax=Polyplosphaeria fusca TaxID=682080 RepID=A0A9P4R2W9_9PLEO|nr:hypothetical protein EJ04DRAFT_575877 [Polyplosphaeria fusca]
MADSSSRSLLQPYSDGSTAKQSAWISKKSPWKIPVLVLSILTLQIGCILATVIVLLSSHKDKASSWKIQPSVLLAFLCGLYLVLLGSLVSIGIAVTWWRSITHGTTLRRLHHIHSGSNLLDLIPAIRAGHDARRVALIAFLLLLVKLAVGPLAQQATQVKDQELAKRINMDIQIAGEIPDGYFGTQSSLNAQGTHAIQGALLNQSLVTLDQPKYRCPGNGTCEALVPAAGVNFGCTPTQDTIDLVDPESINSTVFSITFELNNDSDVPIMFMTTKYISSIDEDCVATVTTDSCNFIPATVWHPIIIQETTVSRDLQTPLSSIIIGKNYTSPGDANSDDQSRPIGPLKGLYAGLDRTFASKAVLVKGAQDSITFRADASQWPLLYVDTTLTSSNSSTSQNVKDKCPLRWKSPTDDLIQYALDIAFRAALDVGGQNDNLKQNFTAVWRGKELWHFTDFTFLGIAVGVMGLGVALAMSLLWGWGELKRHVTLSPLETGKAFGAPILLTAGPEREANSINKEIGHERVAHGDDELVWNGTVYATGMSQPPSIRRRYGSTSPQGLIVADDISPTPSRTSGRGHRRGMSSVSSGPKSPSTPSFEHTLGVSTMRWPDDEDEADISYRPAPHSRSRSNSIDDRIPMLPMGARPSMSSSPQLPPIQHAPTIRIDPVSGVGRGRRGSGAGMPGGASGKRPLSAISERGSL